MQNFAPLSATIGGLLIGLSATLLWVFNGRTAGISNIAGGIYPIRRGDELWRFVFLVALPIGAYLGYQFAPLVFAEVPKTLPQISATPIWLVGTGLLVGVGTRVGRGCTSGHGICGLSRLSVRSFVAVGVFMATAIVTVFIMRHVV
ncbi:MAG: YeeE/YedE thiosulfate transporter family protein [Bauldia sp.]